MSFKHRLGFLPKHKRSIWIHAESLGELKSATSLITSLSARYPHLSIVVTVQTQTGFAYAKKINLNVAYVPFDCPNFVRRAVARINPVVLLSVENSIWPARFAACYRRGIPVLLVNAKLGRRSFEFYKRHPRITRWLFRHITHVFASSHKQAERFSTLGIKGAKHIGELKLCCHGLQSPF